MITVDIVNILLNKSLLNCVKSIILKIKSQNGYFCQCNSALIDFYSSEV